MPITLRYEPDPGLLGQAAYLAGLQKAQQRRAKEQMAYFSREQALENQRLATMIRADQYDQSNQLARQRLAQDQQDELGRAQRQAASQNFRAQLAENEEDRKWGRQPRHDLTGHPGNPAAAPQAPQAAQQQPLTPDQIRVGRARQKKAGIPWGQRMQWVQPVRVPGQEQPVPMVVGQGGMQTVAPPAGVAQPAPGAAPAAPTLADLDKKFGAGDIYFPGEAGKTAAASLNAIGVQRARLLSTMEDGDRRRGLIAGLDEARQAILSTAVPTTPEEKAYRSKDVKQVGNDLKTLNNAVQEFFALQDRPGLTDVDRKVITDLKKDYAIITGSTDPAMTPRERARKATELLAKAYDTGIMERANAPMTAKDLLPQYLTTDEKGREFSVTPKGGVKLIPEQKPEKPEETREDWVKSRDRARERLKKEYANGVRKTEPEEKDIDEEVEKEDKAWERRKAKKSEKPAPTPPPATAPPATPAPSPADDRKKAILDELGKIPEPDRMRELLEEFSRLSMATSTAPPTAGPVRSLAPAGGQPGFVVSESPPQKKRYRYNPATGDLEPLE